MKWTKEQDQFLVEHSNKGAEWCRREMFKEFGVLRSTETIWRHGNRKGISFQKFDVCPSCGREVLTLTIGTGLCKECHAEHLATKSRNLRQAVELSMQGKENTKEYERNRKWLNRHYEDVLEMSKKMSNRRSEHTES